MGFPDGEGAVSKPRDGLRMRLAGGTGVWLGELGGCRTSRAKGNRREGAHVAAEDGVGDRGTLPVALLLGAPCGGLAPWQWGWCSMPSHFLHCSLVIVRALAAASGALAPPSLAALDAANPGP